MLKMKTLIKKLIIVCKINKINNNNNLFNKYKKNKNSKINDYYIYSLIFFFE